MKPSRLRGCSRGKNVERGSPDQSVTRVVGSAIDEFRDNSQVPKHSPLHLFWGLFFGGLGCLRGEVLSHKLH